MRVLAELFENNRRWAEAASRACPDFFARLAAQQAPQYLWIGCSDSRVPANEIVGLLPGELFVHRNVANVVVHTDLNCLSVLQYAVDVLQGAARHRLRALRLRRRAGGAARTTKLGLIDNWLRHVQDVRAKHATLVDMRRRSERARRPALRAERDRAGGARLRDDHRPGRVGARPAARPCTAGSTRSTTGCCGISGSASSARRICARRSTRAVHTRPAGRTAVARMVHDREMRQPIPRRQLGRNGPHGVGDGPRLHGHVRFLRAGRRRAGRSRRFTARSTSASTSWTRPTSTARSPTSGWSAARSAIAATRSCSPRSSATCAPRTATFLGINGRPGVRAPGLRRVAAAARRRHHRRLLPAPRRPEDADRGHGRRDGRAGAGGQGALSRVCPKPRRRRSAARTPCIRSPRCRPNTRCGAASPKQRAARHRAASSGIAFVAYSPLGRGFLTGPIPVADDLAGRRLAPPESAVPGGELPEEPRPGRRRSRRSRGRRAAPPRSSRSPGCCRAARTSFRFPAPHVSNGSRRMPPRRRYSCPARSSPRSTRSGRWLRGPVTLKEACAR